MPNASTISLTDSVAVVHSYEPIAVNPERAVLKNRSGVTASGDETLTLSYSESTKNRPTNRCVIDIAVPVERVIDGVALVDHTARFKAEFILPTAMTDVERAELLSLARAMLGDAVATSYVEDLLPLY